MQTHRVRSRRRRIGGRRSVGGGRCRARSSRCRRGRRRRCGRGGCSSRTRGSNSSPRQTVQRPAPPTCPRRSCARDTSSNDRRSKYHPLTGGSSEQGDDFRGWVRAYGDGTGGCTRFHTSSSSSRTPAPVAAESGVQLDAALGELGAPVGERLARLGDIELGERDDLRARGELGRVAAQLVVDHVVVVQRIAPGLGRHSTRWSRTRVRSTWRKKRWPRPCAFAGAFDEAGNVGEHEVAPARQRHDAEVGHERRERIVGDLGTRARHGGDEGRLADVGIAEQAGVGEQLELEAQTCVLRPACPARRFGRLIGRGREVDVAAAAFAALRGDEALSPTCADDRRAARPRRSSSMTTCRRGRARSRPRRRLPYLSRPAPCSPCSAL